MGYKDMCNTQKIIDEILKKFELENEPYTRGNLRKKITSISKEIPAIKNGMHTNLWDKTRIQLDGRNKAEHIFNEKEKNTILNHHELKSYILKYLSVNSEELEQRLKQEVAEEKELKKEADKLNKQNTKLDNLSELDIDEYDELEDLTASYFYSREEAHQEKMFMMIEALFLKHFTPIDEELLWNDMNVVPLLASTNTDFTVEQMRAIKRYENKDYYKPLDKIEKIKKDLSKLIDDIDKAKQSGVELHKILNEYFWKYITED